MVAGYNSSWPLTGQPRYRPRGTRLLTGMYTIQSILNLYGLEFELCQFGLLY